jgi:hypothetical protein
MERTVLEESWRRNGPVGKIIEVIDDDDLERADWKGKLFTPKYAYFSSVAGRGREK